MRNTLETRLGIFFAVALVAGALILEMVGALDFFRGGLRVQARFKNVQELKAGDPVKIAGKQIGRVDGIDFADNKLKVRMKILDPQAVIRTDTRATIRFSGLMGQNFVALDFGSEQGAPITIPDQELATDEPADVSVLLSKLDGVAGDMTKITANFTDLKLDDLVTAFSDILKEGRPRLLSILTNVDEVTEQVRVGQGTIGKLINDQTLYLAALEAVTNLNATSADARQLLADAKTTVDDVRAGRGTLGKVLNDDQLYRELTEAATNLREVMQKINRGQGSVGKLVNDESLINNANLTLQKLDKATESLEDQGPLSVIGILINPLF